MTKIKVEEEVSIEELEDMAVEHEQVAKHKHAVANQAGDYIRKRIEAIKEKLYEIAVNEPKLDEKILVLDRKRSAKLILQFNDRNEPILAVIESPNSQPESISYEEAALRFDKRRCGMSIKKALQKDTDRLRKELKKEQADFEELQRILPADLN